VFPGLSVEELRSMNSESAGNWDSLATVTLAAVVQEEFNLEIDPEALPQLDSFESFRKYVHRLIPAGK
jgi:acyl carrier protein